MLAVQQNMKKILSIMKSFTIHKVHMRYTMLLHFVMVLSHRIFKFAVLDSSISREGTSHIMNGQKSFKVLGS